MVLPILINRVITVGVLLVGLEILPVWATGINAGGRPAMTSLPFHVEEIASFDRPWAIAFLPDGRLILTEKAGKIFLVTQEGVKKEVMGVPKVAFGGQNGLLDIAPAPDFQSSHGIYLTYNEPAQTGSRLVLARGELKEDKATARLQDLATLWRQDVSARGGQPGGIMAFAPDGRHLFLTVGDRMLPEKAQDRDAPMGKILRMKLDGTVPQDNPFAHEKGVRALTYSLGHRNPYGLAFSADGRLWEHEMGPRGGDEFNLIRPGLNYGWPVVSNGDQYGGAKIPRHATRPEFEPPPLYWNPVIAPAGLVFYEAELFSNWKGSALIGGLASMALVRVAIDAHGRADEVERFDMGNRIRDVAVGPDGAVWLIEDDSPGRLVKLTPRS
ncbi:PQQ-dependent sugar dehydrogenase [Daeguia caeni]|uniref:PQQ-dependent sugar dehydrogenase n=1 Tax=Daeguia caeni TaxID=439612 RepID=A0ABV9H078_9HYPH